MTNQCSWLTMDASPIRRCVKHKIAKEAFCNLHMKESPEDRNISYMALTSEFERGSIIRAVAQRWSGADDGNYVDIGQVAVVTNVTYTLEAPRLLSSFDCKHEYETCDSILEDIEDDDYFAELSNKSNSYLGRVLPLVTVLYFNPVTLKKTEATFEDPSFFEELSDPTEEESEQLSALISAYELLAMQTGYEEND